MKIVVPVMPQNIEEANQLDLTRIDSTDIIEWRADYLVKDDILTVAPAIFEKFSGHEVIFTLRTEKEGGNISLSNEDYLAIIRDIAALYQPDYIDFEYFSYRDVLEEMYDFSNLILSYHNFEETPENLMEVFSELTALAPRVVKIAVMPKNEQDVLDLMNYTRGFKTLNPNQEYVTMSMSKLGRISRLAADLIGSSWTFLPKKEVALLNKQRARLEKFLGGIEDMPRIPDIIYIVDPHKEQIAVKEAKKLGIPVVAMVDTNADPDDIDVIIPANDDAIRAVKLITSKLADAVIEGRQGEDSVEAVEAELAAGETQADSIEEIVEVVEGANEN